MNPTTRIQLLNKSNFDTWKIQVEALLIKTGGWEYVNGSNKRPTLANPPTETNQEAIATWDNADQRAKSDLILSIEVSELREIKHCKTSREVWLKLSTVHESRGPAKKANLLKQLLFTKMTEGQDIHTHLSKLSNTVEKLRDMELEVNEELLTIILLYSLPDTFDNFRVAIESRDTLPTMENLKIKIVEEYDSRHERENDKSSNSALAAWKPKKVFNQNHSKPKWLKNDNKKSLLCQICKKKGHKASDCWLNPNNGTQNKSESYYVTEQCTTVNEGVDKNEWILDSGCTAHMCNNKENFEDLNSSIKQVNMANTSNSTSEGTGTIKLNVDIGKTSKTCELPNTLYVPNLSLNLMSVPKITEKGYNVTFYKNMAIVRDKNGLTTTVADRKQNLYIIRNQVNDRVNFSKTNAEKNFELWHCRFGHVNARTLQNMIVQGTVLGIKPKIINVNAKYNNCEIAYKGKCLGKSFPSHQ